MSAFAVSPAIPPSPRRSGAWAAFLAGLRCTARHWPLLVAYFAVTLLVSGLLLLPLARALFDWVGHRLAAWEMAPGIPGWLAGETLGGLLERAQSGGSGPGPGLILTLPAWPFLLALPATLLSAGSLAVYGGTENSAGRRFFGGFRRYGPTFVLLLFLETALYEIALLATVLLTALAVWATGSAWGTLLVTPVLAAAVALLPWWFEYARTVAVVHGQRNAFRALGRGLAFLRRAMGPAATLALLHFMLAVIPYLPFFLWQRIWPATWWAGTVAVQQILVAALLGARLVRMAGQVALVQSRGEMAT